MAMKKPTTSSDTIRWAAIALLVVVAFFGAYRFASARSSLAAAQAPTLAAQGAGATGGAGSTGVQTAGNGTAPSTQAGGSGSSSGAGCACCGGSGTPTTNGVTGTETEGVATLADGVQRISVDVTTVYNPNVIKLKAGVPAEITFSQAAGCTGIVHSADLGFEEDLSAGPKTVKLQGLQPGTYAFSCGMDMVFGKIVVE